MAPATQTRFSGQYIAGSWKDGRGGSTISDVDPYTGDTLFEFPAANLRDLNDAYDAAAKAQIDWANALPRDRSAVMLQAASVMERRKDEIVDWLIREAGSTRMKAELEWEFVRAMMLESASFPHHSAGQILPIDEMHTESRVYRKPAGVVGVISPWNFPMQLSHRSVAPALALGNSVVIKPSAETPVTGGLLIAQIYEEAGLPEGVLNVVCGKSSEIGDPFITHDAARVISFTGSTGVGRHIAELAVKAPIIKRLELELGGNSPLVILDDADLDQAVRAAVFGRFFHQGQICMSTNRIIVDAKLHDDFLERFTRHVSGLKVGDPREADTVIGPIINRRQLDGMLERIRTARENGARQLLGGEPSGLVLPPHVFAGVSNDMEIAQNELFGPIAPVIKVRGDDEALQAANGTQYGLSSAVFTRDEARGRAFALRVEAGMTHINDTTVDDMPNNPFGGEKNSGIGRFGGEWAIRAFTTDHWVTVRHEKRTFPF